MARQQANYYRPIQRTNQRPNIGVLEYFSTPKTLKAYFNGADRAIDNARYPLHIVVLEDHPFQRQAAVCVAEAIGVARITEAEDGADALAKIEASAAPVDIVICDLKMEGMDGVEFIRHVAEGNLAKAVILASSLESELVRMVRNMAMAYGVPVLGMLDKPITGDALEKLLKGYGDLAKNHRKDRSHDGANLLSLEEIRTALLNNQFVPYFQPKINARTRALEGAEALARWLHPEHGVIPPGRFLPAMEQFRLMGDLTHAMLAQAVTYGKRWLDAGLRVPISVNFSADMLQDTNTPAMVRGYVQSAGLPPELIIVEVTETAVADNMARLLESLTRLRMYGFGLSIDDYGTGYSSMKQLSQIPFTEVKIDRSFVANVDAAPKIRSIVDSTLKLARDLNLVSVAEGVETEKEWAILAELGCDLIQGYIVSKPVSGADFESWASAWKPARYGT